MALRGEGKSDIVERGFVDWVDGLKLGGGEETVVEEGEVDMTGATKRGAEGRKDAVEGVRRLLEELCRSGVVAFSLYLQRMIARGETEERGEGIVSPAALWSWKLRIDMLVRRPLRSISRC